MYGRSKAEPEWHESKIAVKRTPGLRLETLEQSQIIPPSES
jgi:hypothetical protein